MNRNSFIQHHPIQVLPLWFVITLHELSNLFHVLFGSNENRGPLMDRLGLYLENSPFTVRCSSARLLGDEGHRVALVKQSEFTVRRLCVGRVHENSTILDGSVHVGYHWSNVPGSIRLALLKRNNCDWMIDYFSWTNQTFIIKFVYRNPELKYHGKIGVPVKNYTTR